MYGMHLATLVYRVGSTAMHKIALDPEAVERAIGRRGRLQPFVSIAPTRTALLVVDMQTAFIEQGSPAEIPTAREIVPNINRLARALRRKGGTVVWVISTYGEEAENDWPVVFKYIMNGDVSKTVRDLLADAASGHIIWPALERGSEDPIISKNRFSPFVDSGGRMEMLLRDRGIDTVLIVGTVTNVCCDSTARDAAMRNFKTIMVSDGNAARNDDEHNSTLSTFIQVFGGVMTTAEVIEMLDEG